MILIIAGIIILAIAAAVVYRKVVRPLRTIANGVDLLRAQDFSSRLAYVGQKQADRIVDMFNGMMSVLKEERLRLREQNHFLDLIIGVSPMGIILLKPDSDGLISDANNAAVRFLGKTGGDGITGLRIADIPSPLSHTLASLTDHEVRVVRLNNAMVFRCSRLSFMESGVRHPFLLVESLTDEVIRAERKSYEKVIRMMAHEVNNALGGMISVVDTAADASDDPDMREALHATSQRGKDMGAFITKFASAVKIPEPVRIEADLNELLLRWQPMLESVCSTTGTTLELSLPETPLRVCIDPVLMEQVLTNIVKNGAESAGEAGRIRIYVEGKSTLTVEDNGPGISPEASESLFTPFFTTKPEGHGLGLIFVTEVLHSHRIPFSLQTEADGLTRFRLHF
ncbi:MAG: PAS domain-containing sensor histidine kinase [Muribaculaceae bacterium]|nr:PAS domain-containing sensor histidine kinase [Muribaculaceae bacterium]